MSDCPNLPAASSAPGKRRRKLKVLFVFHESSCTGSILALIRLVRWLVAEGVVEPNLIIDRPGDLFSEVVLNEIRLLGPTRLRSTPVRRAREIICRVSPSVLGTLLDCAVAQYYYLRYRQIDIVWFNTLMGGRNYRDLSLLNVPFITAVHELSTFLQCYLPHKFLEDALSFSDIWAATSEPVVRMLEEDFDIEEKRIRLLPACVSCEAVAASALKPVSPPRSSRDTFWRVGAVGSPGFNKGSDLFIQVAISARRRGLHGSIQFRWLGGIVGTFEYNQLCHDVSSAGLSDYVHVSPTVSDTADFFSSIDVLLVPSREESLSLVILEAALHGVPSIAFSNTGGPEWLASIGVGIVVPYADCDAMISCILDFLQSPEELAAIASESRRVVLDRFALTKVGPEATTLLYQAAELSVADGTRKARAHR